MISGLTDFAVLQPAGGLLAGLRNQVFVAMLGRCRYKRGTQKAVVITLALLRRHSKAPRTFIEHGQHEAIVIGLQCGRDAILYALGDLQRGFYDFPIRTVLELRHQRERFSRRNLTGRQERPGIV